MDLPFSLNPRIFLSTWIFEKHLPKTALKFNYLYFSSNNTKIDYIIAIHSTVLHVKDIFIQWLLDNK